ncbi:MAG: hypothetical protein JXJ04_21370, partial [Spirochaetales bacterium]|nr:hypothetical protein [Spirochaetales bacterium]
MERIIPKFHDFHFILDKKMEEELKHLKMYTLKRNLSGVIVKILSIIAPGLEKEHFIGKQRWSKYKYVNDDIGIKRKSTHVYLPFALYKRLKLIHQDLNFYSIAQLLRFFLGLFLDLV